MPYPLQVDTGPDAGRGAPKPGRLKIFFGATPGVGKTHAMLDAARALRQGGADVVVGWVDTRGRAELQGLLESLPPLASREQGFDLDTALTRRPSVLLLDELAHANPAAARHRRRWQDVLEMLDAGIDVWTTLNVADVESLRDVVEQITQRRAEETVPDSVIERADEIELVDAPPEVLLERGSRERIRRGDLLALRELALRRMAARVDTELQAYRREHGIEATWPSSDRMVVCVGPGPHAARLVRAAYRMASSLRADWWAVYVETPAHAHLPQEDRDWVTQHLRLAESLGGRAVRLSGESVSPVLLEWARAHNVTSILVGKPTHARWRDRLRGSLLDDIIRQSGDIEVHVTSGEPAEASRPPRPARRRPGAAAYAASAAIVFAATGVAWLMSSHFQPWDLTLVYMLATVVVATRFGRGPSMLAAALGVALFDFCFLPPYFSFAVRDNFYILTFAVMLVVGITVGTLATRVRDQAEGTRQHAQWVATLHELSRELAEARDVEGIAEAAARQLHQALGGETTFLLPAPNGTLERIAGGAPLPEADLVAAQWVFAHGTPAGLWTDSFRGALSLYLPLKTGARTLGVLAFRPTDPCADPGIRMRLEALAHQVAGALERTMVAEEAKQNELRARTEALRNALLSSVSHDLRTPLAAIIGAATTLLDDAAAALSARQADLARAIYEEADRLNRLVTNLLAVTRVESKNLAVKKEWVPLEELVGAALERLKPRLAGRPIALDLAGDLPLVPVDPVLMEQVFFNLIDNATRHTPEGTPVTVRAVAQGHEVRIAVADRGPGLPPDLLTRVFEKFVRGPGAPAGGSGLGLAIARAVVVAHGGRIEASNAGEGGALFTFAVPVAGQPPAVPTEEDVAPAAKA